MISSKLTIILLSCFHISLIWSVRHDNYQRSLHIDENAMLQVCKLRYCLDKEQDCSFEKCLEWLTQVNKYGDCPKVNGSTSVGNDECTNLCHGHDYHCLGIQKCCSYNCGAKCTNPLNLDTISDRILPPIPQNSTLVSLQRYRNIAEITWQMFYSERPTYNLGFVLEARSHIGYYYDEQQLSNWFSMPFEVTSSAIKYDAHKGLLKNEFGANVKLRPGRWYKFRLLSINGNGTRGYSEPSLSFKLKERPKNPQPPRNFSIEVPPKLLSNNTVYTKAVWKAPRTNYPIEKYRIAWSLYLDSNNGSLWQNEAFVPEQVRQFEFWNLKPNSIYYLQIQALSSFGKKRSLKSPKESLLLNTAVSPNATVENLKGSSTDFLDINSDRETKADVTLRFIGNKKFGLIVRLSWPDQMIGSFIELCSGEAECLTKPSTKDFKFIHTKKSHFDFIELKFSTKYSFRLRKGGRVILSKTFTTPNCLRFLKKHPQLMCT